MYVRHLVACVAPWIAGIAVAAALADVRAGGLARLGQVAESRASARPRIDPIGELHDFEEARRRTTDYAALPAGDGVTGADPADLTRLPGAKDAFVAVLRGRDAVVVLDGRGVERQRLPAPASPTAVAVSADRRVYVAGSLGQNVARFRVRSDGTLTRDGELALGGVASITDMALGPEGVLYIVENHGGRQLAVVPGQGGAPTVVHELGTCHGPLRVVREDRFLLVDCLLDHEIRIYDASADGVPDGPPVATLRHDGPIWSLAAARAGDRLVVALGGVEDRPLSRADGAFGYIDSFVSVYELDATSLAVRARRTVNVGELGVVTPKWIAVSAWLDGAISVETAAYASDRQVSLNWAARTETPEITSRELPPGTVALVPRGGGFVAANALLDAWIIADGVRVEVVPVAAAEDDPPARSPEARAGELLFFTTMMAPWNGTEGPKSRFTCETCHYEGYGDGRIHFTGRDNVHATARPLRGLANNRPHFSRALDRTMADMVHAEFRVANKNNGKSPWFALDVQAVPWLKDVPGLPATMSPLWLRRSFMTFLGEYTHAPNPAAVAAAARPAGARGFTETERRGAEVFRATCEGCHAARLVADEPESHVAFARWEALVLAPEGALVWGSEAYEKTGVTPYVHANGARVPSLRRVYKRFPLFTAGSASDLAQVVARARFAGGLFLHDGVGDGKAAGLHGLGAEDATALLAFLALL